MASELLTNLWNKGELPKVDVNITMDNQTLVKLCFGVMMTVVIILLVNRLLQKV